MIVAMSEHHVLQTFQQAFVPFVWLHSREGGTRVNSFASGGVIPASARGTHYDGLLALVDWFPTVCHLAGIKTIKSNLTEGNTGLYFDCFVVALPICCNIFWCTGVPPLDGVDIFEAITTGAPSPRQE